MRIDRGKLIADGEVTFGEYKRFAFTDDGVSPRVIPGVPGGMHLAAGSEHNDVGVITENARNRARMMDKRMGKLEAMRDELPQAVVHGVPTRRSRSSATAATAARSPKRSTGSRREGHR